MTQGIYYILISSLFFGVVATFLASGKKMLLIGVALIIVLLLCFAWIFIMAIMAQVNA